MGEIGACLHACVCVCVHAGEKPGEKNKNVTLWRLLLEHAIRIQGQAARGPWTERRDPIDIFYMHLSQRGGLHIARPAAHSGPGAYSPQYSQTCARGPAISIGAPPRRELPRARSRPRPGKSKARGSMDEENIPCYMRPDSAPLPRLSMVLVRGLHDTSWTPAPGAHSPLVDGRSGRGGLLGSRSGARPKSPAALTMLDATTTWSSTPSASPERRRPHSPANIYCAPHSPGANNLALLPATAARATYRHCDLHLLAVGERLEKQKVFGDKQRLPNFMHMPGLYDETSPASYPSRVPQSPEISLHWHMARGESRERGSSVVNLPFGPRAMKSATFPFGGALRER